MSPRACSSATDLTGVDLPALLARLAGERKVGDGKIIERAAE